MSLPWHEDNNMVTTPSDATLENIGKNAHILTEDIWYNHNKTQTNKTVFKCIGYTIYNWVGKVAEYKYRSYDHA